MNLNPNLLVYTTSEELATRQKLAADHHHSVDQSVFIIFDSLTNIGFVYKQFFREITTFLRICDKT